MKATVVPREPPAGLLVDHLVALRPFTDGEGGGAVGDPVADVVQALALLLEVLGHRRVVAGGREQLDVAVGHLEQGLLDAVALDDLAVVDHGAEASRGSSRWRRRGRRRRWRRGRSR